MNHLLQRLSTRLSLWLERIPLDIDFLEFTCSQELVIFSAISNQIPLPNELYDALYQLHQMAVRNTNTDPHTMVSKRVEKMAVHIF